MDMIIQRDSKIFNFVLLTICSLLVLSCAEDIQQQVDNRVPLNLAAVNEAAITRATTEQNVLFDAGELINAYISVTGASDNTTTLGNPVVLKAAAANNGVNPLSPNDGTKLYFPPGDNVNASIYAIYPSTVTSSITTFEVNPGDYNASDLMFASTNTAKTNQTVNLQFSHKMAKLIINASGEEGLKMNKITLKTLYKAIGWTPSTGELGLPSGTREDIVIAQQDSYAASLSGVLLFPPQTKDDTNFMEVECQQSNGTTGTAKFQIITKDFEEGKIYTINVKIGPKNLGEDGLVLISPWPATVGTVNVEAVGNLGMAITALSDATNGISGDGSDSSPYSYTYSGKLYTPTPTVTDGKESNPKTLTAGTDYEVAYYNNINAGVALIVVTGKSGSDYEGMSTFTTFNINKATNTMSYPSGTVSVNLSRDAIVPNTLVLPTPTRADGSTEVYGQRTYKIYTDAAMTTEYDGGSAPVVTIDANGNVYMKKKTTSTLYIKASMDDTGNFVAGTASYALTITAGDVNQVLSIEWNDGKADGEETWVFTGTAITPGFKVKDNGNSLASGVDYTYAFSDNITVSNNGAKLTITGQGEYSGTKVFYFSITQATNSWTTINKPTVPIDCGATGSSPGGGSNALALSLPAGTFAIAGVPKFGTGTNYAGQASNVTYTSGSTSIATVDANGKITGVAAGTTTITATVAGTTNYTGLTDTINVTVEKMSYIYVYNGTTTTGTPYYQQSVTAQEFSKTLSADATVYVAVVGSGGGSDQSGAARGGQGGLVVASKTYSKSTALKWYAICGGGGQSCVGGSTTSTDPKYKGGQPGGGRTGTTGSSGAGGGATALCTTNSTSNWDFSDNDSRILVAGGGGGSSYNTTNGGYAGNAKGVDGAGDMEDYDLTTGRQRWEGGHCYVQAEIYADELNSDGGGGGAGYYGGRGGAEKSSDNANSQGGHGGSNFVKSGWTTIYNGTSGTESQSTYTARTVTSGDASFTIQYNGHKRTDSGDAAYRMWPGYIMIKIVY